MTLLGAGPERGTITLKFTWPFYNFGTRYLVEKGDGLRGTDDTSATKIKMSRNQDSEKEGTST